MTEINRRGKAASALTSLLETDHQRTTPPSLFATILIHGSTEA
jgi:hypothetical protein